MADPADRAMCDRAHRRFACERKRISRGRCRRAAAPNLLVIGGLKCGTTSLHHYLGLHPEIAMSRPKELNYFVEAMNLPLGRYWYEAHFDRGAPVRGESSPHYTNLPRFEGVAERIHRELPEVKLIYMVRDPIERIKSHWRHCEEGGYESRTMEEALLRDDSAYVARSRYWTQLQPFKALFPREQIKVIAQEDLDGRREETMSDAYAFLGVDPSFRSERFDRRWQTSRARLSGGAAGLNRLAGSRGGPLEWLDGSFDRLGEPARWAVERLLMRPKQRARETSLPPEVKDHLLSLFASEVAALEGYAGRGFKGWKDYSASPALRPA